MDALIMAAGRGSRLGAHTDDRPKSLIDLGGITPLEWQLDVLVARHRARDHRHRLPPRGGRGRGRRRAAGRLEVEPVWNPFWSVSNVIGSAWMARDRLTGPFVYLHADTVFDPSILDDLLAAPGPVALPVDLRPCEPEQMKARIDDGRILHLSKKLSDADTAGEFIGIGVFRDEALEPSVTVSTRSSRPARCRVLRGRAQPRDRRRPDCPPRSDRRPRLDRDRLRSRPRLARSILPRLTAAPG